MVLTHTFRDIVDRVLDRLDSEPTDRNQRLARRAVADAYRDLPNRSTWSWYDRTAVFATSAPYTTGTIAYDHTGGAHDRMVTLTTGTWPDWSRAGVLKIGTSYYRVEQRVSDTLLTLEERANPGEDVASGTTYSLQRPTYDLPTDFRRSRGLYNLTNDWWMQPRSFDELLTFERADRHSPGISRSYAIASVNDSLGRLAIHLSPTPSAAATMELFYESKGRDLLMEYEAQGSVETTAGSTTVAGTSTAFADKHVGSLFRVSAHTTIEPTEETGSAVTGAYNPYTFQSRVLRVTNTTTLVLEDACPITYSGVKYCLSDPLDVEPEALFPALVAMANANFARLIKSNNIASYDRDADIALRLAKENDNRTPIVASAEPQYVAPKVVL
jgi:hypothetical protein